MLLEKPGRARNAVRLRSQIGKICIEGDSKSICQSLAETSTVPNWHLAIVIESSRQIIDMQQIGVSNGAPQAERNGP